MAAWGQTRTHLPHWMQRDGSQTGMSMAMFLFSYWVVALGGDGEAVSFHYHHGAEYLFDEFGGVFGYGRQDVEGGCRFGRHFDLVEVG